MKKTSNHYWLFAFIAFLFVNTSIAQVKLQGVTLPEKLGKDKKVLTLNGGGVRNHFFIKIYVAGLYLHSKSSDANTILNEDQPICVRLNIISSLVTQERMTQSILEGFEKSTGGNTKPIQANIDKVLKIFNSEPIKIGDTFDVWYVPGIGLKASKNGTMLDFWVSDPAFKKYVFGIWLGNDPVDEVLKDDMLGL